MSETSAAVAHRVGIVTYGERLHAWLLDLPGCITGARDLDELAKSMPLALAEHLGWLRSHGEDVGDSTEWDVVETVDGLALGATGGEWCFDADRGELASDELEMMIRRAGFARADLLASVEGVPDAVLDWVPPRSAFATFDAWAPEVRTIRDLVTHVLQLEVYYRDSLRDGAAAAIFEPVGDPTTERALTVERLRALTDDERSRVHHPVRAGRTTPEPWTVRKVLRRMIAHDRGHAAEILQRRTWLLLGVPNRTGQDGQAGG